MRQLSRLFTLLLLLLSISASATILEKEKFYLLPSENEAALEAIYKKIDLATTSIYISIYTFTHKEIAKRLKNAARRGVKIEIIFDEESVQKSQSMLYFLAKYNNITVYKLKGKTARNKKYSGIMHMKMAVIDHKTVIFGSANWTYSAFSNNYEYLYINQNYAIAKKFESYFETLKKEAKRYR